MKRMHSNSLGIEMVVLNANHKLEIDSGFFAVKDGGGEILWGNSAAEISNSALKINDSGVFASIAANSKCVIPADDFGDPITSPTDIYVDIASAPFPSINANFVVHTPSDGRKQAAYVFNGRVYGNDLPSGNAPKMYKIVDFENIRLFIVNKAKELGWYIVENELIKIPKEYVTVASGKITVDFSEFAVSNLKLGYEPAEESQTPILLIGEYISW